MLIWSLVYFQKRGGSSLTFVEWEGVMGLLIIGDQILVLF